MVNKMINILLTGADGQLGSDFKKLFENKGISYTATDYRNLNITDKVQMEAFFSKNDKFTHIINCAAYNNVDKAETDENVFLVNTEAPAVLAKFAKKINADYVTYSTDFVFNGKIANYLHIQQILYLMGEKIVPILKKMQLLLYQNTENQKEKEKKRF